MTKKEISKQEDVSVSKGNVFEDLGLPYPDELLIKAKLVHKISTIIQERQLTQTAAAQVLGIDQPKISALLKGKLSGFSIERLIKYLNAFDTKVELIFNDSPTLPGQSKRSVASSSGPKRNVKATSSSRKRSTVVAKTASKKKALAQGSQRATTSKTPQKTKPQSVK